MPIAASGRRDLHVAGLGDEARDKSGGADRNVERSRVATAAVLIDEVVDDDARVGGQAERRLVVEGDAEGGIRTGLQRVVLEYRIGHLQHRNRGIGPHDGGAALYGRDLAD